MPCFQLAKFTEFIPQESEDSEWRVIYETLLTGMWDRYARVFDSVWVASAFKGATGPCMFATDIGYHIDNHKSWLVTVQKEVIPKVSFFKGYCLTGWQR